MKAYVINLKERVDRWETFQNNWKHTGLEFVRVDAFRMTNVYHAVFLKHKELLIQAKEREESHLLVLEDDAIPCEDFQIRFNSITKYLATINDWDVMNGGMLYIRDCFTKIIKVDPLTLLVNPTRGCMAHFLYFNINSSFDKIKDWEIEESQEFDALYPRKLLCYASFPFLATQDDGISDASNNVREWKYIFRIEELNMIFKLRDFFIT